MDDETEGFALSVTVPAAELSHLRRRVLFLEAAVLQVLRDQRQLREWFTAGELAALRLPGLPSAASAIGRVARRERWPYRIAMGRGGERMLFHFSALPRRAFAGFIDLVVRAPEPAPGAGESGVAFPDLATPETPPRAPPANATPQWVLPLLRLLKNGEATLEAALEALPRVAPSSLPCPSPAEARRVLRELGILVA